MPGGGCVTTHTEITALKRAEEVLQEAHDGLESKVKERTKGVCLNGGKSGQMAFQTRADLQNHAIGWLQSGCSSLGGGTVIRFPRIWMASGKCRLISWRDRMAQISLLIGVCKFMCRTSWRTLGLVLAVLAGLATPPASAAESLTLLLRWDHQFQFAGYYAALWKGYYKDAGLDVTIRTPFTGKSVVNSVDEVMSGAADFGIGGADLLIARDKGIPVVTLGTIFHESAAEFYINRQSGYSSLGDLPRLRVARRIGDLVDVEFQAMLMAEGLSPDTVKPITSYGSEQAVADGSLDLSPGYSFVTPYILKELGVDFVTLRPRDYGVHFYGDSLFTREDLIDRKEDAVNKFVTASLRGWQYALENSEEIADLIAEKLTRRFPVKDPVAFNRAQIEGVRKLTLYPIVELGHINPGRWQHMHKWLSKINLVTGPLDIDRFIFDPRQQALERQKFLINAVLALGVLGAIIAVILWIWTLRRTVADRTGKLTDEITERKRNEASLAEMSALMQTTLESINQGINVYDAHRKLIAFNQNYIKFNNYSPELIHLGMAYEDAVRLRAKGGTYGPVDDIDALVRDRVAAFSEGEGEAARHERTMPDGRVIGISRDPMPGGGYVQTFTEITERKRTEEALAKASAVLNATFDSMAQGIAVYDADYNLVSFNKKFPELFRLPPGFLHEGMCVDDIVRQRHRQGQYVEPLEEVIGRRRKMKSLMSERTAEHIFPDGTTIMYHRQPMPDGGCVTTHTDITERKLTEDALREARDTLESKVSERTRELTDINRKLRSETAERKEISMALAETKERFRRLLESTNAIPWEADVKTWIFTYVGPQAVELLGYPRELWLEKDFWVEHIHPEDRAKTIDYCLKSLAQRTNYEFEYRMLAADGRTVWVQDIVNVLKQEGEPVALRGFMIDITERKSLEESQRNLRLGLIKAQEEERRKISRELHDDFSQRLALLAVEIHQIGQEISESKIPSTKSVDKLLSQTQELAADLHRLSHQLHPAILDQLGLGPAVKSLCREVSEQYGLLVKFTEHELPAWVSPDIALCLYRTVQEGLRNIVKHSGAKDAEVQLTGDPDTIYLRIADQGVGFDPKTTKKKGLGLVSIEERIRLVKGEMSLQSRPSHGTCIDLRIPTAASDT